MSLAVITFATIDGAIKEPAIQCLLRFRKWSAWTKRLQSNKKEVQTLNHVASFYSTWDSWKMKLDSHSPSTMWAQSFHYDCKSKQDKKRTWRIVFAEALHIHFTRGVSITERASVCEDFEIPAPCALQTNELQLRKINNLNSVTGIKQRRVVDDDCIAFRAGVRAFFCSSKLETTTRWRSTS